MGITLGNVSLGERSGGKAVLLAPMSGVTDRPFRELVRRLGGELVVSEMIASRELLCAARADRRAVCRRFGAGLGEASPTAVQLAGTDPGIVAEAARLIEDNGADIVDLNFGCPAKKVVNSQAGSALMRDEDLSARIFDAAVRAVSVPVTAKMRLGWDGASINAPLLARRAEQAGVQMITVHGRTRCQFYSGRADWDAVRRVRDAIRIPLIVNGDIADGSDARHALAQSGADGVMVGRACYGRPWVPAQIMADLAGRRFDVPGPAMRRDILLDHYEALLEEYGRRQGCRIARKHVAWAVYGMRGGAELRDYVNREDDPRNVMTALRDFFDGAGAEPGPERIMEAA